MSSHPNAILQLNLTPDDLPMRTWRAITDDEGIGSDEDISIGSEDFHHVVLQEDYDESYQIGGKPGDIVVFKMVTYGYGDFIPWGEFLQMHSALEAWAEKACKAYNCSFEIRVTANYW